MDSPTARLPGDARPRLPRGVRLTQNEAQGGWVLLAPERVFKADSITVEILKRCTGGRRHWMKSWTILRKPSRRPGSASMPTSSICSVRWRTRNCWSV